MMCTISCNHVEDYKKDQDVLISYEILHAFYVSCIAKDSLKRKARDCLCMAESCKIKYQRVHACLKCVYFGCFNARHIHDHAQKSNHILALDTSYGHIFCFICGDYQYDPDFEKLSKKQFLVAALRRGPSLSYNYDSILDLDLLKKHHIINLSDIGVRGLVNMGNTCYMSVIIQALVHAPIFRDYFLSLRHNCENQNRHSNVESISQVPDKTEAPCFACEMSEIVQEFYSGKQGPYAPDRLLYSLWLKEIGLRGDSQQDAHQCFLALINNLHLSCQGDNNSINGDNCKCIIDTMFTGFLKYEYTCTVCKNKSTKNDSFKDIPLDLELELNSHALSADNGSTNGSSLYSCLKRAIQGHEIQGYSCSTCHPTKTIGTTQMSLKKLPIIISFHLKQFSNTNNQKIFVSFPEFLDMSTFLLSASAQSNQSQEDTVLNGVYGKSSNKFYLFAVVEHVGEVEGGHYKCYVRRHKHHWFLCNDANVEPVDIKDILQIKAYLLFYHRQFLEYEVKNSESHT